MKQTAKGGALVPKGRASAGPPMMAPPRQPSQSQHMEVFYKWPLRITLTVSSALAFCVGLWIWLGGKRRFDEIVTIAGRVFVIAFVLLIVLTFAGVAWAWYVMNRPQSSTPRSKPRRQPRIIPVRTNSRRAPPTRADNRRRVLTRIKEQVREGVSRAGERLEQAPPPRRLQAKFAHDVQPVEAAVVSPETCLTEDLYSMTHYMFGRSLTRDNFELMFPKVNGQAVYAQCKEWWTALGWVEEDGRGTMHFRYDEEHELYWPDRGLRRIARRHGFRFPQDTPPTPSVGATNVVGTGRNGTKTEPITEPITERGQT